MNGLLSRIGSAAATRPWRFVTAWVMAAVFAVAAAGAVGGTFEDEYGMPGTEVQRAADLLTERFPGRAGTEAHIVVHSSTRDVPASVLRVVQHRAGRLADVTAAGPPAVSADGRTALLRVQYGVELGDLVPAQELEALEDAAAPARRAGFTTEYGGPVIDQVFEPGRSELVGFALAAVILLVVFGSLLAASLPLAISAVGLGIGMSLVTVLAGVTRVSTYAPTLAAMVGIGVGVDYALFVVARHRTQLLAGTDVTASVAAAMRTAGRSVFFAGLTVLVAICGLVLSGSRNFMTMGFATAVVVAVCMTAAITLLPALLGLAGTRVLSKRVRRALEAGTYRASSRRPLAARWGELAVGRPWSCLIISLCLVLTLAAPLLAMDLGEGDAGNEPTSKTNRRAYDLIAVGFGPGANGPLTIAVDLRQGRVDLSVLQRRLAEVDGVASVAPPVLNATQDTAVLSVVPTTAPQDAQTADLVAQLRSRVLPAGAGITGPTAGAMAFSERTQERLPHVVGGVVLVSLVLLVMVFRSIVAPIKAAIMNLLSVGAAYGAVVALFQWGWGKDLLGLEAAVPVNAFVPVFMFAILFGLSMDYEVFLLSRVREEWDRTHDRRRSVVEGLAGTAPVITSAALIMIAVFAGFGFNDRVPVKMMGVGMAVAVLVDATLVRMVLVPSTMVLLGRWNWWLPGWLERRLPTLPVEVPEQARPAAPGRTARPVEGGAVLPASTTRT